MFDDNLYLYLALCILGPAIESLGTVAKGRNSICYHFMNAIQIV